MANNQKGKPSNGLPFLNIYNMTQKQKVIYLKGKVHKMKKYISIDIGGTAIKYGIICENAEIMMKETMKTEAEKGGSAILEKVFVIVERLPFAAPERYSASPAQFTSFSTSQGILNLSSNSFLNCIPV